MISRKEAIAWLQSMPQKDSDMNHYLESEAIMRTLAQRFKEDEDRWGMIGLLHDVDWAYTRDDWSQHCVRAAEMLAKKAFSESFITDVQSHAYGMEQIPSLKDKERTTRVQHALVASETVTGLIYAYASMRDRRIFDMKVKGLKKKFKDKTFAANCNRDLIGEIEKTGMDMTEFFQIAIDALNSIKEEIGLE
ncbi:MAG: HDIG domain-containing metalloprotein [Nanoarchaeota archaeon]